MPKLNHFYQHVGFHFAVTFSFNGPNQIIGDSIDSWFQSVSGLDAQLETETIKEGGENRFEHVIPVRTKYSDLVLKRGVFKPGEGSKVTDWCLSAFDRFGLGPFTLNNPDNLPVRPADLDVILLNEDHEPLMRWKIIHAWPKAWKFGELNAERGEVLIETLELSYNWFEFKGS